MPHHTTWPPLSTHVTWTLYHSTSHDIGTSVHTRNMNTILCRITRKRPPLSKHVTWTVYHGPSTWPPLSHHTTWQDTVWFSGSTSHQTRAILSHLLPLHYGVLLKPFAVPFHYILLKTFAIPFHYIRLKTFVLTFHYILLKTFAIPFRHILSLYSYWNGYAFTSLTILLYLITLSYSFTSIIQCLHIQHNVYMHIQSNSKS